MLVGRPEEREPLWISSSKSWTASSIGKIQSWILRSCVNSTRFDRLLGVNEFSTDEGDVAIHLLANDHNQQQINAGSQS